MLSMNPYRDWPKWPLEMLITGADEVFLEEMKITSPLTEMKSLLRRVYASSK